MRTRIARTTVVTVASVGFFSFAMWACGAATGWGLVLGAVGCIAIGVADYFIFKGQDQKIELRSQYEPFRADVIDRAYKIFDLEKHCTDQELKKAYRAALLKYHPDKKGTDDKDDDQIKAVLVAYELLKSVRQSSS